MDEWTAFLRARLDEKEATAKAAQAPSPWKAASHESDSWIVTDATGEPLIYDEGTPSLEEAAHIALNDPARVLREVEAIRAHIRMWEAFAVNFTHVDETEFEFAKREALEDVLAADAAIWSDHPDYPGRRQEAVTEPG